MKQIDTPLTQKNDFPMPFLISADTAADLIMHGLDSGRFEIVFPWRMAAAMKLLRVLPYAVVFRITRRMVKGSRV
jgi:short-subunit dehydrogenase